ncbi:MAG: type 1 glutamine amidotransferase domain-containing protein [Vulcanimicrobiota bacterium]
MRRLAMILTEGFEDSEANEPLQHLRGQGFEISIISPKKDHEYEGKSGEVKLRSDQAIKNSNPADFQGLIIPGGHSPEKLRLEDGAVDFVKHFVDNQKPIASICHGAQLLISADGVKGRKMTCYKAVAVDLKNAGANYVDQAVVEDGNIVTSRQPDDLPQFCQAATRLFSRQPAASRH